MLKIKVKPEDFIVEEVADISIRKEGDFSVYFLEKRGWNTVDVLKMLAKKLSIPNHCFSYGGKKDKYALTSQYITIAQRDITQSPPEKYQNKITLSPHSPKPSIYPETKNMAQRNMPQEISGNNYSVKNIGYMDRPMGPDLIVGNKFHIVVRNLTENELQSALHEIEIVKKDGYPNYFDDQRFGSFDSRQGFIAEKILKKHYNGALKTYFSRVHPADSREEREHRKFQYENWGNWEMCLQGATSKFEKESYLFLLKDPKGFVPILQRISHEEMILFFSAYQSHLWNEILRKIIKSVCPHTLKSQEGIAGSYYFYTHIDDKNKEYLNKLVIPMPASNIIMPDSFTDTLYSEVLQEAQLRPALFNMKKLRQAFFKGIERRAIIFPDSLAIDCTDDEVYPAKKKLILKFFLPRGCFGTMFIKRISV